MNFITEIKLHTTSDFTIMFEVRRKCNSRVVICYDCTCLAVYHCMSLLLNSLVELCDFTSLLVHLFDSRIIILVLFIFCGNYTICNGLVNFFAKYDFLNYLGL
jgi:hypothetical protein